MTEARAAGLGAELRTARQAQGWELPQLAASLRIRQSYLEAIEAGQIGELPGATYALGFVRAYASALGLPGEDMARRFKAETTLAGGDQPTLRFPAPVPQRGVPAGALMLLGLVILIGAYGGWYWVTEHRATPVETVPPIPDRMAGQGQKPLPSPQVASLLPATAPPAAPPAPPPGGGRAQPGPGTGIQAPGAVSPGAPISTLPGVGTTTPAASVPATGEKVNTGASAVPAAGAGAPPQAGPTTATPQPQPGKSRVMIRTTADAWVTVKQKGGPALFNKLMHAGDSWPVPVDKDGVTLTTGNAGGTQVDVDGAPIPVSLGASGAVRRDLPLDADMLKSGKLPPLPGRRPKPAPVAEE